MRLIISQNPGLWAANYICNKIKTHNYHIKKNFVLGLPTGSTPVKMYEFLIDMYNKKQLSFQNVVTFNMDEYIGLDKNHEQSYYSFMHKNLFNSIDIKKENINIPDGMAVDIKQFCVEYEERIKQNGGIDLFVGGVGENGHIAFNEPYSSLSSQTRDKELDFDTMNANARFFGGNINLVPKSAITVGIDTLLESKEVMILVQGVKKAHALQQCLEGAVSHSCPISALQFHKKAIIVADESATIELKVKTYKYFSSLQDEFSYIEEIVKNTE